MCSEVVLFVEPQALKVAEQTAAELRAARARFPDKRGVSSFIAQLKTWWRGKWRVPYDLQQEIQAATNVVSITDTIPLIPVIDPENEQTIYRVPDNPFHRLVIAAPVARQIRGLELDLRVRTRATEGAARWHIKSKLDELRIMSIDRPKIVHAVMEMCFNPTHEEIVSQQIRASRTVVESHIANDAPYFSRALSSFGLGVRLTPRPTSPCEEALPRGWALMRSHPWLRTHLPSMSASKSCPMVGSPGREGS